jgi:hypothetical protein
MITHEPKANTGFPDPTEDEERLADLIWSQLDSLVSQLHHHGKLSEETGQCLWDLVVAVEHIAQQDADDHVSHSMSSTGYQRDD